MIKQNRELRDTLILGFAIFSMYFGAGNVIFPPFMGLNSASDWKISFIAYFLADIGFATIAMFALLKAGGDVDNLTGKIGKINGKILMAIIILCIGPLIALPRTGAVAYEMLIVPYFGASILNSIISSIFYFGLIMFFTFKPSSMFEILGKILSPILFFALIILILKGIFTPIGEIKENTQNTQLFLDGLLFGYQTLDLLAALAFGIIVIKMLREKDYKDNKTTFKIVGFASLIAAFGIMLVYFGLTYLGATTSSIYPSDIEKVTLLNNIVYTLFGSYASTLLAFVVFLACFTTGAALVCVTAEYFSTLSNNKISYKNLVILTSIFAIFVTNIGLESIISFAAPILFIVYPAAIVLVVLTFFDGYITNQNIYKFSSLSAVIYCTIELLSNSYLNLDFIKAIPLYNEGLAWILIALIFGFLGYFVKDKQSA